MRITIPIQYLKDHSLGRSIGFTEEVMKLSKVDAESISIDVNDWQRLSKEYRVQTSNIVEPSITELSTNFAGAMLRWTKAGFKTSNLPTYKIRYAACLCCDYWDGSARMGLGKCNAPGCGCTKIKLWLASEKCPIGKWPSLTSDSKIAINTDNNMTPQEFNQRLADRKSALQARVQQASDNVTLTEARLAQAKQRLALVQGELKAVSDVITDQESAPS